MQTKKGRILVVDDEDNIVRLVKSMLEPDGYEVFNARDGAQALTTVHERRPDLIFMDIFMPNMDGYSACNALKADDLTRNIPVVMLSAVGLELNRELGKKLGAELYLTKPFTHKELTDAIERFFPVI